MSCYLILLFLLLCGCVFTHKSLITITDKLIYAYIFLALFLFSALRKNVGMDYEAYSEMYMHSYVLNEDIKEYGLRYVFLLCNEIGLSYEFIVAIFSFLTVFYACKFIYKFSPNVMFSVLIFFTIGQFYQNTFNIIRQCLVIYILLSHLNLVLEHKYVKFVLLLLFCSIFIHQSALFLLILILCNLRINIWFKFLSLIVLIPISEVFILLIQNSPYSMYLGFERFISDVGMSTYLLFTFSLLFFLRDIFKRGASKEDILLSNINFLLLIIYILAIFFSNSAIKILVVRLSYYFSPILIVLIPNQLEEIRKKVHFNLMPYAYIFFIILFVTSLYLKGEINNLLPYQTILSLL